jgi:hypothetical protein
MGRGTYVSAEVAAAVASTTNHFSIIVNGGTASQYYPLPCARCGVSEV